MKSLITIAIFLLLGMQLHAQYVYTIKADSVKITNCDSAELILENHTQNVPGFLFNTGNGRTIFKRGLQSIGNGSYIIGGDTLQMPTNAWLQGGNSWGTAGVFGTLDSNTINFYTNNRHRAQLSSNGTFSTDSNAVFHGVKVGIVGNNNTTTVVGSGALLKTSVGNGSVAVGYDAGENASGTVTLFGTAAGANEKGNSLIAIGPGAGGYVQGGYDVAMGENTMAKDSVTGWQNTAVGSLSAISLTTGGNNTFMGMYAGDSLTTGSYNTIIGANTGQGLKTGNYNTIVGAQVAGVAPGVSNSIILSDGQGNTRLFADAAGDVGVGTLTPHSLFQVTQPTSNGTGTAGVNAGSGSVTGVGTEFTNTFKIGDSITIYTFGGPNGNTHETQMITAIASDVSMTTTPFTQFQDGVYTLSGGNILEVKGNGYVGIATDTPTSKLDINAQNGFNQLRLRTSYTPTSSSDTNGNVGDFSWDGNYLYIKTAAGWKRSALTTF